MRFKVTNPSAMSRGRVELTPSQDCLTKNGYKQERCEKLVDALYECCQAFYQKQGDDASSVCCPKANLLKLKMEQRKRGIK